MTSIREAVRKAASDEETPEPEEVDVAERVARRIEEQTVFPRKSMAVKRERKREEIREEARDGN